GMHSEFCADGSDPPTLRFSATFSSTVALSVPQDQQATRASANGNRLGLLTHGRGSTSPRVRPIQDNSWGPMALRADSVSLEEGLYLRNPYFPDVESYISKVTTAGQLTLPKKIRKALGLGGPDYVEVALVGRTAVIRRLREDDEF